MALDIPEPVAAYGAPLYPERYLSRNDWPFRSVTPITDSWGERA